MAHEIIIPPFGDSITSALIAQWHVEDGDTVQQGDTLVTLETDKVSSGIDSKVSGTIKILVQEDEEMPIGTVIATIEEEAEKPAPVEEESVKNETTAPVKKSDKAEVSEIKVPAAGDSINSATVAAWAVGDGDYVRAGQLVVTLDTDKVSSELFADISGIIKIDVAEGEEVEIGAVLGRVTASEAPEGAVVEESKPEPVKDTPAPVAPAPKPTAPPASKEDDNSRVTRKKMSPLRRKIASHLVNAQQTAAILTTFNEVDMTEVMKLRKSVQEDFIAKHGVKLGFMSFFVKAVVQALKDVPSINARIDGTDIIENHFYDIGVAIGTDKGLIVPVLRDCDSKSFAQVEQDILDYAKKAKEGKIEFEDLSGGVFTVSNGGVYGSLLSTPILNPPQSGILGMHTIQQRPMAVSGEVVIRPMMYLALSYDHRLVDGKEAVTFLIRIKDSLENPTRMLLEM